MQMEQKADSQAIQEILRVLTAALGDEEGLAAAELEGLEPAPEMLAEGEPALEEIPALGGEIDPALTLEMPVAEPDMDPEAIKAALSRLARI